MSRLFQLPQLLVPSAPFDEEARDIRAVFRGRCHVRPQSRHLYDAGCGFRVWGWVLGLKVES